MEIRENVCTAQIARAEIYRIFLFQLGALTL